MQIEKKQQAAKKAIMDACLTCRGYGCRDCASKVECINVWSKAGIPVSYWSYDMQTFKGDNTIKTRIENCIKTIDLLYTDGRSFAFSGKYGTGKTFSACEIIKTALRKGYTCKYTTMSEIVDMVVSKEERYEFKQWLLLADFLVIDEFDSRHIPTSDRGKEVFGANLENVIRTRFQNKLPIFFCTNNASLDDVFDGTFQQTFSSLFADSNLIQVPFGGVDLR